MGNYLEMVTADVMEQLKYEPETACGLQDLDREELEQKLYDDFFVDDSITGNASGSYTFNSSKAREFVLSDMDTIQDALREFCVDAETIGEKFLDEDWEYLDVTARCYVLSQAISDALDEIEKE